MRKTWLTRISMLAIGALACTGKISGKGPGGLQDPPAATQQNYPESASGLEHLLKDIIKAQKENDPVRAEALLNSLVLPDFARWYSENFDDGIAKLGVAVYGINAGTLSAQLARFMLEVQNPDLQRVQVVRFEKNCDDNASELTFAMLDGRLKQFPLYEARFVHGNAFRRLFAFAYVDGAFRYVIAPKFEELVNSDPHAHANADLTKRVRLGDKVQAASLVKRVQPQYPAEARQESLSGAVKLHAIIGKDGNIRSLRVLKGRCSLARAAVDAVRQWHYRPTLLNAEPVEVDTEIDVFFQIK